MINACELSIVFFIFFILFFFDALTILLQYCKFPHCCNWVIKDYIILNKSG